jgi:uncharacterized protein YdeI (YjbR/CyaY-like superfamily)
MATPNTEISWHTSTTRSSAPSPIPDNGRCGRRLCYGWIDSHRETFDDYYLQRYSARRPNGCWSRVNVDKAEALIIAGRVQVSRYAAIRAVQADGRWDAAYEPQRNTTVPEGLSAALADNDRARHRFETPGPHASIRPVPAPDECEVTGQPRIPDRRDTGRVKCALTGKR